MWGQPNTWLIKCPIARVFFVLCKPDFTSNQFQIGLESADLTTILKPDRFTDFFKSDASQSELNWLIPNRIGQFCNLGEQVLINKKHVTYLMWSGRAWAMCVIYWHSTNVWMGNVKHSNRINPIYGYSKIHVYPLLGNRDRVVNGYLLYGFTYRS